MVILFLSLTIYKENGQTFVVSAKPGSHTNMICSNARFKLGYKALSSENTNLATVEKNAEKSKF